MRRLWNVVVQRSLMITLVGLVVRLASSSADAQCGAICLYETGGTEMGRASPGCINGLLELRRDDTT